MPAKTIRQWVSGDPHKSRLLKEKTVAQFLVSLFYLIQVQSVNTDVVLTGTLAAFPLKCQSLHPGYDLYHGHSFIHVKEDEEYIYCDLGILFHAKVLNKVIAFDSCRSSRRSTGT